MSVHEEIREQQKKLKGQGFKAHWDYFWEYYKIHTLVVVCVIILLATLIRDVKDNKPYAFYAVAINSTASAAQDILEKEFAEYSGINTEEYDCYIDTTQTYNLQIIDEMTIATSQKIMANMAASELDVMMADSTVFTHYANQETFLDLRTVLSSSELSELSGRLVYVDQAYLDFLNSEEYQHYISTGEFDAENKYAVMADAYNKDFTMPTTDPTEMQNPIPVGIKVDDSAALANVGAYDGASPVVGIVINTKHTEVSKQFLWYLLGK
ncbi:MAG: hypothetical protein II842_05030 [Butyrivibrio sp.]|nr:hypothetical protein [Butyrivibrio sp.]